MRKIIITISLLFTFTFANPHKVEAQFLVSDIPHTIVSGIIQIVSELANAIAEHGVDIMESVDNIQNFFQKSVAIVNGVVGNLKYVEEIIELQTQIIDMFETSLDQIENNPSIEDKLKHISILIALLDEGLGILEVFDAVTTPDGTIMDDEGRVNFIVQLRDKSKIVRNAMRLHVRRINQEIYYNARHAQELTVYKGLFNYDN